MRPPQGSAPHEPHPPVEVRADLVAMYQARIKAIPESHWRLFAPDAHMLAAIREVWDEVRDKGMPHADLRAHRAAWDAAVASAGGEG